MKSLNLFLAFTSFSLLVACDGKRIDRVHNAGAIQNTESQDNKTDNQKMLSEKEGTVWSQDKAEMQKILSEKKVDAAKVSVHLSKIEKTLLHAKTLTDKNYYLSTSFRDLLLEFNRGVVYLQTTSPEFLEKSGLLKRYISVLMEGCQVDLSECKNLAKFKVDQLTAQVLSSQAASLDKKKITDANIHEFYQLLKASLDMQARAKNYEVESLYFKHAIAYLQFLKNSKASWAKPMEARLKTDVSMILTKMNGQYANNELSTEDKKKYCDFVNVIDPLGSNDKNQFLEEQKRRDLVQDFLLCQAGTSSLEDSLVKNLKVEKESQINDWKTTSSKEKFAETRTIFNMGYNFILEALKKDPNLIKSFNLKLNHAQDGAFFVVDKLYYEKITLNQAQQLIESLKIKSDADAIKMIRNYTQNQTAHLMNETLRIYYLIFEEKYKALGLKDTLFKETINQVNAELFPPWYSHFRKVAEIEKLLDVHFARKYRGGFLSSNDSDFVKTQKDILALRSELSNIKNHMNLVLSTSMEYAMFYYMSQTQGTVKFDYNFGTSIFTFDMKAEEILSKNIMPNLKSRSYRFFNIIPKMGDLQEGTEESLPILSLQYALKIGLFDKFKFNLVQKETKKSGLELFVTQFLKEIIIAKRAKLESSLVDMDIFLRDTDLKERAAQLCANPMDTKFNIQSIESLQSGFAKDSLLFEKIGKIYDKSKILYDIQNPNMNINATQQVRRIIDDYLGSVGSGNHATVVKLFDDQINYITEIQKKLTLGMLELDSYFVKGSTNCLVKLARSEQYRRTRLLYEHIEHFKNVHAGITLLKMAEGKKNILLDDLLAGAHAISSSDVKNRVSAIVQKLKEHNLYTGSNLDEAQLTVAVNALFAIHNDGDIGDKYGYFVREDKLNYRDGKPVDLKKISFFSSSGYIEGTWDAVLRTKSYLKKVVVAPQVLSELFDNNYSLPSYIGQNLINPQTTVNDTETMTIWSSSKKIEVPYEADQDKFVANLTRKFAAEPGASVSWFLGSDFTSLLEQRTNWLIEMSMSKPLVYGKLTDPDCVIDGLDRVKKASSIRNFKENINSCGVLKITAEDIIQSFLERIEFVNHNAEERNLYELLALKGKNPDKAMALVKYSSEESTHEWTYFDELVRKNYINKGGDAPYIEGMFGFNEFKKRKDRGLTAKDHLLGIGTLPITLIRESLRKDILPQIEWVFKLEKAIKKMEVEHGKDKSKKLPDIIFSTDSVQRNNETLFENRWRYLHVKERSSGTPIYLRESSESAINWFRGYIETAVVEDGQCEFLPKAGDSDAMGLKQDNCSSDFKKWFEVTLKSL